VQPAESDGVDGLFLNFVSVIGNVKVDLYAIKESQRRLLGVFGNAAITMDWQFQIRSLLPPPFSHSL
jgi:hypothetical protein